MVLLLRIAISPLYMQQHECKHYLKENEEHPIAGRGAACSKSQKMHRDKEIDPIKDITPGSSKSIAS